MKLPPPLLSWRDTQSQQLSDPFPSKMGKGQKRLVCSVEYSRTVRGVRISRADTSSTETRTASSGPEKASAVHSTGVNVRPSTEPLTHGRRAPWHFSCLCLAAPWQPAASVLMWCPRPHFQRSKADLALENSVLSLLMEGTHSGQKMLNVTYKHRWQSGTAQPSGERSVLETHSRPPATWEDSLGNPECPGKAMCCPSWMPTEKAPRAPEPCRCPTLCSP